MNITVDDAKVESEAASYVESPGDEGPLQRHRFGNSSFVGGVEYASFNHVTNHILGAYCCSPFASRGEDALALVWDGGIVARLYQVRAATREVTLVSALLPITGNSFADFCAQFGPFSADTSGFSSDQAIRHNLSIAGKAMAYAALGNAEPDAFSVLDEIISGFTGIDPENARELGAKVASNRDELMPGMSDADIIATFQDYLGQRLLDRLAAVVRRRFPGLSRQPGTRWRLRAQHQVEHVDPLQRVSSRTCSYRRSRTTLERPSAQRCVSRSIAGTSHWSGTSTADQR